MSRVLLRARRKHSKRCGPRLGTADSRRPLGAVDSHAFAQRRILSAAGRDRRGKLRQRTAERICIGSLFPNREKSAACFVRFAVAASLSIPGTTDGFVTLYRGGGLLDYVRGEVSADLRFEGPEPSNLRFVIDINGFYMSGSAKLAVRLPPHGKWLRLEPKDLLKLNFHANYFVRGDPAQEFRFLARQARRIQDFGPQEVRGADAHHYRLTIDMPKLTSALREQPTELSGISREYYTEVIGEIIGLRTLIKDVWLDDTGMVIRESR
jgi:hypothetical protein